MVIDGWGRRSLRRAGTMVLKWQCPIMSMMSCWWWPWCWSCSRWFNAIQPIFVKYPTHLSFRYYRFSVFAHFLKLQKRENHLTFTDSPWVFFITDIDAGPKVHALISCEYFMNNSNCHCCQLCHCHHQYHYNFKLTLHKDLDMSQFSRSCSFLK